MAIKLITKTITVNASREKVWEQITNTNKAAMWASEFMPDTRVEGSFELGKIIYFKDDSGNGLGGTVIINQPVEHLKINYNIAIEQGVEHTEGVEYEKWIGCYDDFYLTEDHGNTILALESVAPEEYYNDFVPGWDKSLNKIKEMAEN